MTERKVKPVSYTHLDMSKYILTPKPADTPRINGARVFGVRPGSEFLYTIAATIESSPVPIQISDSLPDGIQAQYVPKNLSLIHIYRAGRCAGGL